MKRWRRAAGSGQWAAHCRLPAVGCLLLCMLLAPGRASAQARGPARASSAPSIRGFGTVGMTIFSATDSFTAVFGSSAGPVFGGGIEIGLQRNLFVSVAASRFARTGRRLFVFEDEVFDLNEPTEVRITPLELSLGYRFSGSPGWTPYVAGGIGWHHYTETSPHATEDEDVSDTFTGYHGMAGIEWPLHNWISVAGEGQFTSVPNALGESPTSVGSVYDEHDLGGFSFRVRVIIGR